MTSNWQWAVFLRDNGAGVTYLEWILSAWGWTLSVSALGLVVALLVGVLMGTLRTLPQRWLVAVGSVWTELFRNVPIIVQVFIWYHVVPALIPWMRGVPDFVLVVLALGFFTSARIAEQVRAGILSLPRGQRHAGLALGLTLAQTYRHVIMPMALRVVIPPLTSESMNIVKNSSVAFAVSISELTMFALQAQEETARGIEIYLAVTGLYFVSAFAINRLAHWVDRRTQVPGLMGAR